MAWVLSLFYFLTFGGFVALSVYLPTFLVEAFGLERGDAAARAAGFVVLPAIIQMQQYATGNSNNPVVMKWKGGQLTEAELAGKRHTRGSLLRFIQQLQEDARKADPEVQLNPSIGIPIPMTQIRSCER